MFNQKQIEKAMKRLGIQTVEVDAEEVVIKCSNKDIVIKNPHVSKIKMGNRESFQVIGEAIEKPRELFSREDVKLVMEQAGCSEEEAKRALEETKDIAEAILKLKKI